eukprot:7383924-Prymnesium_polylepis.1
MPTAQRIQSASVLLPVIALKRPAGHGLKARATEPMPALGQVSARIANGALRRSLLGLVLPRYAGAAEGAVVGAPARERCPSRTRRCSGGGLLITVVAWRAQLFPGVPGAVGKVALEACRAGIVGAGVKIGCCFAFAK